MTEQSRPQTPRPGYPYAHAPRLPEGDVVDPREILDSTGPVELEIGPGRGGFLFERVQAFPDVRILGLEVRLKWATLVDERLRVDSQGRGRVFAEDARAAIQRFPNECLTAIFVHFPDPWWKKRHQKRLVVSQTLGEQAARVLVPGGELFVQTDVEERAEAYQAALDQVSGLVPAGTDGPGLEDHPYVARSPRERRSSQDGLPIFRLRYRRPGAEPMAPRG